jgi:hypothetical protein
MKRVISFLIVIALIVAALYGAFFALVNTKGKDFIVQAFQDKLGLGLELESLVLTFPFNFEVKGLKFKDIYLEQVQFSPALSRIILGRLAFNRVYVEGFELSWEINPKVEEKALLPYLGRGAETSNGINIELIPSLYAAPSPSVPVKHFSLKRLQLRGGTIKLIDAAKDKPVVFKLKQVEVDLRDFVYPKLTKFDVAARASLELNGINMPDAISVGGWADYYHKNMDMEFNFSNLDYSAFRDYYSVNWQPEKVGIKKGMVALKILAHSENNELVIDSLLSVEKVEFVPEAEIEDPTRMRTIKTIFALRKGPDGKSTLPFRWRTSMDSPQFDFASLKETLREGINYPKLILETVAGKVKKKVVRGADTTKDIATGTVEAAVDVISDLVDEFKDAYKKYKE